MLSVAENWPEDQATCIVRNLGQHPGSFKLFWSPRSVARWGHNQTAAKADTRRGKLLPQFLRPDGTLIVAAIRNRIENVGRSRIGKAVERGGGSIPKRSLAVDVGLPETGVR